jgi:Spy/CpxP family protein refolding chaperone
MNARRALRFAVAVKLALTVGVLGVAFSATGCGRHHSPEKVKAYVSKRIDKELDNLKANEQQRAVVHAARDRLFAVVLKNRDAHKAMIKEALELFESNAMPPARVDALRSEHEARSKLVRDEVTRAITEIHAALTPEQRKQLGERIRSKLARYAH